MRTSTLVFQPKLCLTSRQGVRDHCHERVSVPDHPAKRIHELLPWNWCRKIITAEAA
jgi:hypothetical protein